MVVQATSEAFVVRLNIARYKELLVTEADSERRRVIYGLLADAESRLTELDGSAERPEGSKPAL